MKFAAPIWLWGIALALLVIAVFIINALTAHRLRNKFGHEPQVLRLLSKQTPLLKALQSAFLSVALVLLSLAAAQPQYGKGTRILPKTNLDVAIVLDYSKSMYARDVSPSRISRAKVEVENLIRKLGGARFAGIAFAGESLAFPLTSDGPAIAQFFRGLSPNDMPAGGTAIARALEEALGLFKRDPRAESHEKVVLLVTDGEDLEGNPRLSAEKMSAEGIRIEVVQIGGQSPEPLPNIDQNGIIRGLRRDSAGKIMTTSLSPEGEATLQSLADLTGGQLVRSSDGSVGVDEIASRLRKLMSEELSEKVETVFADVYQYPLGLALLLLLIESLILRAPKAPSTSELPKKKRSSRAGRKNVSKALKTSLLVATCIFSTGCDQGRELFIRQSPVVNDAIEALAEKNNEEAIGLLTDYLETGPCEAGIIGAGERSREKGDASFDLALALIEEPQQDQPPSPQLDCGLRLLSQVVLDESHTVGLRAEGYYLIGNLHLRKADFDAAIEAYDASLRLMPGGASKAADEKDTIGDRAAYNRALAQRLKEAQPPEEKNDQDKGSGDDSEKDDSEEDDSEKDDSEKDDSEKDDSEKDDSEKDDSEKDDSDDPNQEQDGSDSDKQKEGSEDKEDGQSDPSKPEPKNEEAEDSASDDQNEENSKDNQSDADEQGKEEESSAAQDSQRNGREEAARNQRLLDEFEQAPTLEQERARLRARKGRRQTSMEDK